VARAFPDFIVYTSNDGDVILVARKGGPPGRFDERVLQWPAIKPFAERLNLDQPGAVQRRPMGQENTVLRLYKAYGGVANSDYFPVVDQRASKTRFTLARVGALLELQMSDLPLLEMLDGSFNPADHPATGNVWSASDSGAQEGWLIRSMALGERRGMTPSTGAAGHLQDARFVDAWVTSCPASLGLDELLPPLLGVATAVNARIPADKATELWKRIAQSPCAKRASEPLRQWIGLFAAVAERDPDAMSERAKPILEATRGAKTNLTEYAFLAALAGNVCRGRREEAEALLSQGPQLWIRLDQHKAELRYLYEMANGVQPGKPAAAGRCVTAGA
jgi:hypothetical protein